MGIFISKPHPTPVNAPISSNPTRKGLLKASWARWQGSVRPVDVDRGSGLNKNFGFLKNFECKYEIVDEVWRGNFSYTCRAQCKKGKFKGLDVAVKIIPKAKMTTAIAISDVRREVKILRALTGHHNTVEFHEAYEDHTNVYVVMELCEGGALLDRILSRGGKYTEDDAKAVLIQILNVVAFCHLQGVVHLDLKLENFLFKLKDEDPQLKVIDFRLSDYVKPDEMSNAIAGTPYYMAPEVLHGSHNNEADVWSIGVISYILLCGSRPFWARTLSGIFEAVLKADLSFDEPSWTSVSSEAKDFVKRLLNKDPRKRMSAAQALCHSWIKNSHDIKFPLDILVLKLMRVYMRSSPLRKAALWALSKTLTVDELFYLKEQFMLLGPNKNGTISLESIKQTLMRNSTDAMKDSRVHDLLVQQL
ncbi:CDPK-related protein kinase isoform X3 [Daucus carota subsp. sativus]|uniref:CDPK-related protein kinase isoform X3 n=1 Tax=Daucus carota subsp. sativus TaxID=79200 RepID=UPI0007EFD645|nr:PREDICTED: CDPK-related protein kinase-like isoform X2 [Daucus carota subsp. sativus]